MASFIGVRQLWLPIATVTLLFRVGWTYPDQGKWTYKITQSFQENDWYKGIPKSLYKDSKIVIEVTCDPKSESPGGANITIGWALRCTHCYEQYIGQNIMDPEVLSVYYNKQKILIEDGGCLISDFSQPQEHTVPCSHSIRLPLPIAVPDILPVTSDDKTPAGQDMKKTTSELPAKNPNNEGTSVSQGGHDNKPIKEDEKGTSDKIATTAKREKRSPTDEKKKEIENVSGSSLSDSMSLAALVATPTAAKDGTAKPEGNKKPKADDANKTSNKVSQERDGIIVPSDGVYLLIIRIDSKNDIDVSVQVEMKGSYGYLSAKDWPLLPFYGMMCGIYVIYAVAWLVVSALQWRDLLRIQFWIGGVVFLGMIEMAVFYAEYQSVNLTGQSVSGAVVFAEIISCLKRTLARMLVIIVSLGFGIIKPRLGPMLHRVVGVGALYFVLGSVEGCLRALKPEYDPSSQALMASIPLAVLDSGICWWVFSSLVQTTRTLRLRRNLVKLSLYRHFTNALIFAVLASLPFMLWSIHSHRLTTCLTDWKELWVDEAYWHMLFAVVLLVIMVLWRPANNNQRFAFTPLLDAADDEDEEDDTATANDAFGMKMRTAKNQNSASTKEVQNDKAQDDLKWVEENIPSSLTDTTLPSLLDSDEEIMTARFERNKME